RESHFRGRQVSGLQLETTQGVQRLSRQARVTQRDGDSIALLQAAPRASRIACLMSQHRPPPERLGQRGVVVLPHGRDDQRVIDTLCVGQSSIALADPSLLEQGGRVYPSLRMQLC